MPRVRQFLNNDGRAVKISFRRDSAEAVHRPVEPETAWEMSMQLSHESHSPLAHVGAEISGVDLAGPTGGPELTEIRRALGEYGVVFLRD